MPEIGKTISHFRIVEKLGQDGLWIVYRAKDTTFGSRVTGEVLPGIFSSETTICMRRVADPRRFLDWPNTKLNWNTCVRLKATSRNRFS